LLYSILNTLFTFAKTFILPIFMYSFKKINNITGWVVFFIAAITYLLTIEPTASFWDCGEFIATAYRLEVGHPPGAPLFMMLGRVFSLLSFGNVKLVAPLINAMSALASAFTILFLFWTITHLSRKMFVTKQIDDDNLRSDSNDFSQVQILLIMASGIVGALAYTFSDTFWFSAVEGEVYALSSFFTAIVFWAILKWENVADEKFSNRWLILIGYLMGLSIGVHLLNLLAIPAIVFVYYFKKYKPTSKGILLTSLISVVILGTVQYGVIQGLIQIAASLELLFVNKWGAPFLSGFITFGILLIISTIWAIWYTHRKRKIIMNTIMLVFAMLMLGYSSYAMIVIRSAANPPIDENDPENFFNLISYLNREQYGDTPLLYGQYYSAPVIEEKETKEYYTQKDGKYVVIDHKIKYEYDSKFKTFFPRIYSTQGSHIQAYRSWANIARENIEFTDPNSGEKRMIEKPTFIDNMLFFFKYQVGHMYIRYFMWNFVGRQNDTQGHGAYENGNWISGIPFIDNLRLGNQSTLPDHVANNKAKNKYYFLPLILGIVGMFFQYQFAKRDFFVTFLFYFFTGLAIILYLNQTPYQPRERDYAYAGSFYVFTIWIGLGVLGFYRYLQILKVQPIVKAGAVTGISLLAVPTLLATQNWDDHNRSGRYTVIDFASNYLNSCEPNAILFTYGDNDTFPLWYAQEVEGVRTDVRIVNLSLLSTDWYISQMQRKAYLSEAVPMKMPYEKYQQGTRDILIVYDKPEYTFESKYKAYQYKFKPFYKEIYDRLIAELTKSSFSTQYAKDFQKLSAGVDKISPLQIIGLIQNLSKQERVTALGLNMEEMQYLSAESDSLFEKVAAASMSVKEAMDFAYHDEKDYKLAEYSFKYNYIPSKKLFIPVDKEKVLKNGTVSPKYADKILNKLEFTLSQSYFGKSEMMILDLLANFNWDRPIYFATSVGDENFMNLQKYFRHEGFAYRLVPYANTSTETASVDTDILYDRLMKRYKWGRMNAEDVLIDEQNLRTVSLMNVRDVFDRLANALLDENKKEKALEVLDTCMSLMPHKNFVFDYSMLSMAETYYRAEAVQKAQKIIQTITKVYNDNLLYYKTLTELHSGFYDQEGKVAKEVFGEIVKLLQKYKDDAYIDVLKKEFIEFNQTISQTSTLK